MESPVLFYRTVSPDEAKEVVDFIYWRVIDNMEETEDYISWFSKGKLVGHWTKEYGNIMVSKAIMRH